MSLNVPACGEYVSLTGSHNSFVGRRQGSSYLHDAGVGEAFCRVKANVFVLCNPKHRLVKKTLANSVIGVTYYFEA